MSEMIVGAQLFTVREYTKTLEDIARTLDRVREIGYTAVQFSALGPVDPKALAKVREDSGLICAATHYPWERFLEDLDAVIEEHELYGCSHPAIGGLKPEYHSLDGLKRFCDELGPVAEKLAAAGMDFSYHNHSNELAHFDGKPWLARLLETAPAEHLNAEIDTYWIQAGGGSPAAWIRRYAGRQPLLHAKDMSVLPDREIRMAAVGSGNLDWPGILDAAREAGVQYVLVEQDETYGEDPFGELAASFRFLTGEMGLK